MSEAEPIPPTSSVTALRIPMIKKATPPPDSVLKDVGRSFVLLAVGRILIISVSPRMALFLRILSGLVLDGPSVLMPPPFINTEEDERCRREFNGYPGPGNISNSCGFTDLGASINLMPLSVWKKLGLPELISTQITLELANRDICTPKGIARDVFVPVRKLTFSADFVIVDYESDPCVPLILGDTFFSEPAHA
ncbi:reverse transcriptase domain-containing protein [Tanacetum coccineum]